MPTRLHPTQAISLIDKAVTEHVTEQLKLLLETKHLYQRVPIDPSETISALCATFTYTDQPNRVPKYLEGLAEKSFELGRGEWFAINPDGSNGESSTTPAIGFINVKMFCSICKSPEAFAPMWMRDIDREVGKTIRGRTDPPRRSMPGKPVQQHFCVAYVCQHCSSEMVIVTVARRGWYLSLEGRSPLEIVSAPTFIPKKERHLFAEAMVARNVGRVLAAIFLLRTFIEQFSRRETGMLDTKASGEEIMDAYSKTLPDQVRDLLPSLKVWYGKLSVAIHSASVDQKLLEEAWSEIEKHFKIRDAFGIAS